MDRQPGPGERIRAKYGAAVDPNITLDPEVGAPVLSDFSSEVARWLAARPDASGRYSICGEIDRGGMGAILRVWDNDLRRHLAMKVVLGPAHATDRAAPDVTTASGASPSLDPRLVGRFLEEAQVTGQLDHPGIVPVHELGLDEHGRIFFTMKLVKGEDLRTIFARVHRGEVQWSTTRALGLLLKVCEAMSYAHAKGVIHRDLKPANVMIGKFGEVFVMDWGLAKVLGREDDRDVRIRPPDLTSDVHTARREHAAENPDSPLITMDGDIVGTPAYMSPEQAQGRLDQMGAPSDVYSVGAMLYHLMTGRVPYVAPDAFVNNRLILAQVQAGPPQPVDEIVPEAPAELIAICERAMARDPRTRYADMSALAEDLRAYLEQRVVSAYEGGAVAELRKWVVRNRLLAVSAVTAVILLFAGVLLSTALVLQMNRAEAEQRRAEALEATRDRERNLTGARVLDSVLQRTRGLFAAPSQPPALLAARGDALFLLEQAPDLPLRLAALESAKQLATDAQQAQDLGFQIAEIQRQIELLPALEEALSTMAALEQRIERESRHRPPEETVRQLWEQALAALAADARFAGAPITPHEDFLPLGPTEPAGLWAFLALETADFSTPLEFSKADEVGPERGVVLLLVPGGARRVGARRPSDVNEVEGDHCDIFARPHDRALASGEAAVVELAPYYLGRYEVTRAQWERIMGDPPSVSPMDAGVTDPGLLPVVLVGRPEASTFATRIGLQLPTEAQWEAAYRAGTTTPAFIPLPFVPEEQGGPAYDWRDLARYANILDSTGLDEDLPGADRDRFSWIYPAGEPQDGFVYSAPVGSFEPNPFGLFDMGGNVWEWCRDDYVPGWGALAESDGLQIGPADAYAGVIRGGSWNTAANQARAAERRDHQPENREYDTGFRVALTAR